MMLAVPGSRCERRIPYDISSVYSPEIPAIYVISLCRLCGLTNTHEALRKAQLVRKFAAHPPQPLVLRES